MEAIKLAICMTKGYPRVSEHPVGWVIFPACKPDRPVDRFMCPECALIYTNIADGKEEIKKGPT